MGYLMIGIAYIVLTGISNRLSEAQWGKIVSQFLG
jgi:hypothetical protein